MRGETGDLVAETLGGDDGNLISDLLVGLEIISEARVVFFNDDARGFLNGLGADSALKGKNKDKENEDDDDETYSDEISSRGLVSAIQFRLIYPASSSVVQPSIVFKLKC